MSVEAADSKTTTASVSKSDGSGGPPAIPHITTNYVELRTIVTNLVGFSYQELQNVIETLPSVSSDLAKKRRFLDYVIKSRQAFVKLYVLAKWAKVSKEIAEVVDVVSWLHGQQNCFNNVVNALYGIERMLGGAKLRNPDIETALEVLKNGKPTHDMHNFIPPEKLEPQLIYNVLRNLDVLLSIRLGLVEELPEEYRNYKIHDGRVKFTMERRFTVDLGVADDKIDARFFLVDFAFCMPVQEDNDEREIEIINPIDDGDTDMNEQHEYDNSPSKKEHENKIKNNNSSQDENDEAGVDGDDTTTIVEKGSYNNDTEEIRIELAPYAKARLETIVNEMLHKEKLSVVLDWLLQFAQNYKLACFNTQLHRMVRELYAGHVQYTFHGNHSLLVVSYWCSLHPLSTSYSSAIEIGLLKGEKYKISLRWIRDGRLVEDIPSYIREDFGTKIFDIEWLVNEIMDLHIRHILENVYKNLKRLDSSEEYFWLSDDMTKLTMSLTETKSITYSIDRFSGLSVLSTPNALTLAAERQLNEQGDPAQHAHLTLLKLRQSAIKEHIISRAEACGWISNTNISITVEDLAKYAANMQIPTPPIVKNAYMGSVFCLRRPNWAPIQFLIVYVAVGQRPKWFISEIASHDRHWVIQFLEEVFISVGNNIDDGKSVSAERTVGYGYKLFESLTHFTGCRFNVYYIFANLAANGVKYSLLQSAKGTPTIMIDLPSISGLANPAKVSSNWAHSSLIVNVDTEIITVKGRTKRQLDVKDVPTQQSGVELNPQTGLFQFTLENNNQTTTSFALQISARLSQIERVVEYIELIRSLSLDLISASMNSIEFAYGNQPDLTATIRLHDVSEESTTTAPISLEVSDASPHKIVMAHLQQILTQGGLLPVVWILQATLPLYLAINAITPNAIVIPRAVGDLQVYFDDEHILHIELKSKTVLYVSNSGMWPSMEELWKQKQEHTVPLQKGLACQIDKISLVLEQVKQYI